MVFQDTCLVTGKKRLLGKIEDFFLLHMIYKHYIFKGKASKTRLWCTHKPFQTSEVEQS